MLWWAKKVRGLIYSVWYDGAERLLIAAECIGDAKWFIEKQQIMQPNGMSSNDRLGKIRCNSRLCGLMPIARCRIDGARGIAPYEAGELRRRGKPCKLLAADASWEAAEACLQTHGGFGFAQEYDVERNIERPVFIKLRRFQII